VLADQDWSVALAGVAAALQESEAVVSHGVGEPLEGGRDGGCAVVELGHPRAALWWRCSTTESLLIRKSAEVYRVVNCPVTVNRWRLIANIQSVENIQQSLQSPRGAAMATLHSPTTSAASADFRRASASIPCNDCVEVRVAESGTRLRDSKDDQAAELRFCRSTWLRFIGQVKHAQ
jgi:hypothetical protein